MKVTSPGKVRSGIGADSQRSLRADAHEGQVLFEHVADHPHPRQVGDPEQRLARHEAHAGDGRILDDDPGRGRDERQGAARFAGLAQALQLLLADVPVAQPLQRGGGELLDARLRIGSRAAHALRRAVGDQVFALGGHELRAVHLGERLAARHRLAGRVDVQLLDPAFELRRHRVLAALVDLDRADRTHRARQRPPAHRLDAHAQRLDAIGADLHGAGRITVLALVHRDVVHPHLVLLGDRRRVGQSHRVAVVQQLALAALRRRRRAVAAVLVAADWPASVEAVGMPRRPTK